MAQPDAEAAIRKAFGTLITAEPDSYDLFDAEQVLLDARETHADLCKQILSEMSGAERSLVAHALATAAEVLEEGDEAEEEDDVDGCVLAEEDIAMDPSLFEPEVQGTLEAQIHYAFGFMTRDDLDCTDAQTSAMKFLRRHRKRSPKEFFTALKLLADSSKRLACTLLNIDAE